MTKLLSNLPIEDLTEENDYIGIIEKGNLIKTFFLANKHEFSEIKFFSIYGEWGSGKSTLMKFLQKELSESSNTFFFEAWEFESDSNLSYSLLDFLVQESESNTKKAFKELLDAGFNLLEGFARSITVKTPILNISGDKIIEHVSKEAPKSFHSEKEEFKAKFQKWEQEVIKETKKDVNIVFIDDLDRCEPENILNLLSAIKLFFTFGKKTIFICGIDRKAVQEAVKTKYGEVVKANEYLEKVFDISFTIPKEPDISKLVNIYFDKSQKIGEDKLGDLIYKFFKSLHFTNPRRIKKILNKYLIIKMLKENSSKLLLPNILYDDSGSLFETYLTLYLLILKEFDNNEFVSLFDLNLKTKNYTEAINRSNLEESRKVGFTSNMFSYFQEKSLTLRPRLQQGKLSDSSWRTYIVNFFPVEVDVIKDDPYRDLDRFVRHFNVSIKRYSYYFTCFLIKQREFTSYGLVEMQYSLLEYKKIISNLI